MEKATFDDLIKRSEQREKAKTKYDEIIVKSMGKTLMFKNLSDDTLFDAVTQIAEDPSKLKEVFTTLIYNSCEILHDPKLHETLGVVDPFDTIQKLFDANEIVDIGNILTGDFEQKSAEKIKN